MKEDVVTRFLGLLERREAELLAWGIVDVAFTRAEMREVATEMADADPEVGYVDPDALIDALGERALLFTVPETLPVQFRTRSAETIRLLQHLRQWFPGQDWIHTPQLVSDFRYQLGPRLYPRRDVAKGDFAKRVAPALAGHSSHVADGIGALVDRGDEYEFAAFQQAATAQVLTDLTATSSRGTVVAAGTGSGKTLAFYIPALAWAAANVSGPPGTRIMALYPRIELLKDQFQAAYTECRRLDGVAQSIGNRPLRIGSLYGSTPFDAEAVPNTSGWSRRAEGYVCPMLRCPHCGDGILVWRHEDLKRGQQRERLVCTSTDCGGRIEEGQILLTRKSIQATPPDVLFTTTEMLNRRFTDSYSRHIFGIGPLGRARPPRLVLLDEVHVYTGTTGAQTALLLRRWRAAVNAPVAFVGLSATLLDAAGFFSDLTGLAPQAVTEVSPSGDDLIAEGMEYSLALRSNPASGTSQLSTSIQTIMLLRRMLDTGSALSRGLYGQRVYAFTDQLDSANRFYWDTLSAEGWLSTKRPLTRQPRSLAALRAPDRPDANQSLRVAAGQSWDAPVAIGHQLGSTDSLKIRRTSSQDAGVDLSADVIIATASLEVGFDDAQAGAVLQHKAPRDSASFIQRRGRAGRSRGMRPWTVTVLSDYGRDRLAYESYEQLFSPSLSRLPLPIANRYVLRMQATYALFDFLAGQLPPSLKGNVWNDLARPAAIARTIDVERQSRIADLCRHLLESTTAQDRLTAHLSRALQVSVDEATALMWEGPRSILLEVIPTIHRRLTNRWGAQETRLANDWRAAPLPEYVPPNLFSDLLVPEVELEVPQQNADSEGQVLPIVQALSEFAPGRASKRYAVEYGAQCHWLPVPMDAGDRRALDITTMVDSEPIGTFDGQVPGVSQPIRCVRPLRFRLQDLPNPLRDSSMALPRWHREFLIEALPPRSEVPNPSAWNALIEDLRFFMHADGTDLTVRRFTSGSTVDLKFQDGSTDRFEVDYVDHDGGPISLGFELTVDALRILVDADTLDRLTTSELSAPARRGALREAFGKLVRDTELIPKDVNDFKRDWLVFLFLSAIAERCFSQGWDLDTALLSLEPEDMVGGMSSVLEVVFATFVSEPDRDTDSAEEPQRQRLHADLAALAHVPETVGAMRDLLLEARDGDDTTLGRSWGRSRALSTLGAAVVDAVARLCPEVDTDELVVDIDDVDATAVRRSATLWISEASTGGVGFMEQISRKYVDDPRRFWRLVETALRETDAEVVDREVSGFLNLATSDNEVTQRVTVVRDANRQGNAALRDATTELMGDLRRRGMTVSHAVLAALNTRVLRPGSSSRSDATTRDVLTTWHQLEDAMGIDLDLRTVAFVVSLNPALDLPGLSGNGTSTRSQRFASLLGVLWPRGVSARSSALRAQNRFNALPATDRLLLAPITESETRVVDVRDPDWRGEIAEHLRNHGTVRLKAPHDDPSTLATALVELQTTPMDIGWLLAYPRVVGAGRDADTRFLELELSESPQ